jgi:hypothetical protein
MRTYEYPLRRVLKIVGEAPLLRELLECGHERTPKSNSFSKYDDLGHASRRRCRKCPVVRAALGSAPKGDTK